MFMVGTECSNIVLLRFIGFEIITAVSTKMAVFCGLLEVYQRCCNPEDKHLRTQNCENLKTCCGLIGFLRRFQNNSRKNDVNKML